MSNFHRMRLLSIVVLLAALSLIASSPAVRAQGARTEHSPTVLYPGPNVITIRNGNGIDRITVVGATPNVSVDGDGELDCEKSYDLRVELANANTAAALRLEVIDCRGTRRTISLQHNTVWTLDVQNFGGIPPGRRECMMFRITSENGSAMLDSVTVPDPHVSLRFFDKLPVRIQGGMAYRYEVCFTADEPGFYRFPVITWMRREQPSGGYGTYAVADTGIVYVIEPPEPAAIPRVDPTTFRSVAVPNAVIPPKGQFFVGSYDVLGVIAGYSVTDNVMVLGGGAIPLPDDWGGIRGQMYGAASIGVKAGLALTDRLDLAVGYQIARSIYDEEITPGVTESAITVNAPWGAVSYGDDDSRASLTLGYAMKHHVKPLIEFDENVVVAALGGDYRFGGNWKVAGEIAYMGKLGVLPIVATARYFTDTYALDAGLAFVGITLEDGTTPAIPLAPVISAVFVF